MFTLAIVQSALELGFIYALVAMALFLSFRVLNIADMTVNPLFGKCIDNTLIDKIERKQIEECN